MSRLPISKRVYQETKPIFKPVSEWSYSYHSKYWVVRDIFKEFYKTQFQILKEENPGLRLNQYKERIYKLWKRSSENPYSNK